VLQGHAEGFDFAPGFRRVATAQIRYPFKAFPHPLPAFLLFYAGGLR
jgi:hypothetical protein